MQLNSRELNSGDTLRRNSTVDVAVDPAVDVGVGNRPTGLCRTKVLFIIHGERADRPDLKDAVAFAAANGCMVASAITTTAGDALAFAREGAALGFDTVVAVGGDGTVNDVVNGLAGTDVALGIIPAGTANDFARQVGIPDDPREALNLILRHKPVLIDTASLNGRRFINVSTGGVGAEITAETQSEIKDLLGPVAYAITGVGKLMQLQPTPMRFTGPGFELVCNSVLFAVGNASVTGGGIPLTPKASVTDGLIDLCVVEEMTVTALVPLLLKLRSGDHIGAEGVHYAQLPEVRIEAEHAVMANVDGESITETTFEYRAHPGSIMIHLGHLPGGPNPSR